MQIFENNFERFSIDNVVSCCSTQRLSLELNSDDDVGDDCGGEVDDRRGVTN